jgi:hypothetical protein
MWLALPSLSLLVACSDGSSRHNDDITLPVPEVSLEETGSYSGTLETSDGDVALMTLVLARDGTTAISLETDDSEQASIVLWGESDGSQGAITFTGRDTRSGESVTVDLQFEGETATGQLQLADISGSYELAIEDFSQRSGELGNIVGDYARVDNPGGLSQWHIGEDGSVQVSGACEASGSIQAIDDAVNIYHLTTESDCAGLDVLISRQDIEAEGDVLALSGASEEKGISTDLYRI